MVASLIEQGGIINTAVEFIPVDRKHKWFCEWLQAKKENNYRLWAVQVSIRLKKLEVVVR